MRRAMVRGVRLGLLGRHPHRVKARNERPNGGPLGDRGRHRRQSSSGHTRKGLEERGGERLLGERQVGHADAHGLRARRGRGGVRGRAKVALTGPRRGRRPGEPLRERFVRSAAAAGALGAVDQSGGLVQTHRGDQRRQRLGSRCQRLREDVAFDAEESFRARHAQHILSDRLCRLLHRGKKLVLLSGDKSTSTNQLLARSYQPTN